MSYGNLPSLGSATGSRVDSAAKHIMACKVDTKLLSHWRSEADTSTEIFSCLHNAKMKWCMHKDEIVLNTTKQSQLSNSSDSSGKAYPMVITTVGDMEDKTKDFITHVYKSPSATEFTRRWLGHQEWQDLHLAGESEEKAKRVKEQILTLPEFRCQGVALGQAWASYLSGDTVASVLVGGMVTIQNGAFSMHTGDLVQWYFDWECNGFDHTNRNTNGYRIMEAVNPEDQRLAGRDPKRKRYNDERLYGTSVSFGRSSGQKSAETMVRVKSYRMCVVGAGDEKFMFDHFGDKSRVFGKCISGGRPWDAVDIMLMTQSL